MSVLKVELKKVIKSRRTWVVTAAALFMTCLLAYLPVLYETVVYYDEAGSEVQLQGIEAIRYKKILWQDITGVVTPQMVRQAVEAYQDCLREYGVMESYELPEGVYSRRLAPYSPLVHGVKEAFADRDTGMAPSLTAIDPAQVDAYYEMCTERLNALMKMKYKDDPEVQKHAADMYAEVAKPYQHYPGLCSNPIEYGGFLAFFLVLLGVIIAAPVFSSDYQTGADDILRCTKHGKSRLGIAKIVTTAGVTAVLFTVCMTIYLLVSNSLFGWESVRTSMQIEFSVTSLADWNLGDLELVIAVGGLVSAMATIAFVLLLSANCKSVMVSLSIGLLCCIAPTFIYMTFPPASKMNLWLQCLLPSSGVGLPTGYFYAAIDYEFLQAGGLTVWMPYALLGFAALEAVLFGGMALRHYIFHKMR